MRLDQNSAGEKNCPLIRGVRLLECPLIGENTVFRDEMTYLRKENKAKSEIIRMLSDKQSTSMSSHTNKYKRYINPENKL